MGPNWSSRVHPGHSETGVSALSLLQAASPNKIPLDMAAVDLCKQMCLLSQYDSQEQLGDLEAKLRDFISKYVYLSHREHSQQDTHHAILILCDLVNAACITATKPEKFPHAVCLLYIASHLSALVKEAFSSGSIKPAMIPDDFLEKKSKWLRQVQSLTSAGIMSPVLSKSKGVSHSGLLYFARRLELGVLSIGDLETNQKAVRASIQIIGGAIKSLVTMKLDDDVLKGVSSAFHLSKSMARRRGASIVADKLILLSKVTETIADTLSVVNGTGDERLRYKGTLEDIEKLLDDVYLIVIKEEKRWEVFAAFVRVLATAILSMSQNLLAVKTCVCALQAEHHSVSASIMKSIESECQRVVDNMLRGAVDESDCTVKILLPDGHLWGHNLSASGEQIVSQCTRAAILVNTLWAGDKSKKYSLLQFLAHNDSLGPMEYPILRTTQWADSLLSGIVSGNMSLQNWLVDGVQLISEEIDLQIEEFGVELKKSIENFAVDICSELESDLIAVKAANNLYPIQALKTRLHKFCESLCKLDTVLEKSIAVGEKSEAFLLQTMSVLSQITGKDSRYVELGLMKTTKKWLEQIDIYCLFSLVESPSPKVISFVSDVINLARNVIIFAEDYGGVLSVLSSRDANEILSCSASSSSAAEKPAAVDTCLDVLGQKLPVRQVLMRTSDMFSDFCIRVGEGALSDQDIKIQLSALAVDFEIGVTLRLYDLIPMLISWVKANVSVLGKDSEMHLHQELLASTNLFSAVSNEWITTAGQLAALCSYIATIQAILRQTLSLAKNAQLNVSALKGHIEDLQVIATSFSKKSYEVGALDFEASSCNATVISDFEYTSLPEIRTLLSKLRGQFKMFNSLSDDGAIFTRHTDTLLSILQSSSSGCNISILAGLKSNLESVVADVKHAAVTELEYVAATIGDIRDNVLGDASNTVSDLIFSESGLISDFVKSRQSKKDQWRVREIAALAVQQILQNIPSKSHLTVCMWKEVAIRKALEQSSNVRKALEIDSSIAKTLSSLLEPSLILHDVEEKQRIELERQAWIMQEQVMEEEMKMRLSKLEEVRIQSEVEIDPLKKQVALIHCIKEHRALQKIASNVSSYAAKFDLIFDSLSIIQSQLLLIDEKITAMQTDISEMKDNFRKLIGRPVMDLYREWSASELHRVRTEVPRSVYVEAHVCGPGSRGDFKSSDVDNPSSPVLERCTEFLSSSRNVLLLSGPAGSGKSTAFEKVKLYVLDEYTKLREKEGFTVILFPVALPALKDPVSMLFEEGTKYAFGTSLKPEQVHDLLDQVHRKNSKIEFIFMLDAYDELRQEFSMKNLWRTNNLEQFRPEDASGSSWPKVIVSSRSELFADKPNYENAFVPIESVLEEKDNAKKAKAFFEELRFIPFRNKRDEYLKQHVAIQWRNTFWKNFKHRIKSNFVRNVDSVESNLNQICQVLRSIGKPAVYESDHPYQPGTKTLISVAVPGAFGYRITFDERSAMGYGTGVKFMEAGSGYRVWGDSEYSGNFKGSEHYLPGVSGRKALQINESSFDIKFSASNEETTEDHWGYKLNIEPIFTTQDEIENCASQLLSLYHISSVHDSREKMLIADASYYIMFEGWYSCLNAAVYRTNWEVGHRMQAIGMVASLAAAIGLDYSIEDRVREVVLFAESHKQDGDLWVCAEYEQQYQAIAELEELTSTPFMLKVVVDILHTFKHGQVQMAEIKSSLVHTYGESTAEVAWAIIRPLMQDIRKIQFALDKHPTESDHIECRKSLFEMGERIALTVMTKFGSMPEDIPHNTLLSMGVKNDMKNLSFLTTVLCRTLDHSLYLILRRSPTRRFAIYESFIQQFIDRGVQASARKKSAVSDAKLFFETVEFARHFALFMTQEGQTRLAPRNRSDVFSAVREEDIFFRNDAVVAAARHIAPLRKTGDGFLSFIHKTIQEFYVAEATIGSLQRCVQESMHSQEEIKDLFRKSSGPNSAQYFASLSAGAARKRKSTLSRFCESLCESVLGNLIYGDEVAVIDFVIDSLLSKPDVLAMMAVAMEASYYLDAKQATLALNVRNDYDINKSALLAENLVTIISKPIPRRHNRSLLHEAAREGNEALLLCALDYLAIKINSSGSDFLKKKDMKDYIDAQDLNGKTPLYLASEGGHSSLCRLLMTHVSSDVSKGAPEIINMRPLQGALGVNIDNSSSSLKTVTLQESSPAPSCKCLLGFPAAAVFRDNNDTRTSMGNTGIYMFEVEVTEMQSGGVFRLGWTHDKSESPFEADLGDKLNSVSFDVMDGSYHINLPNKKDCKAPYKFSGKITNANIFQYRYTIESLVEMQGGEVTDLNSFIDQAKSKSASIIERDRISGLQCLHADSNKFKNMPARVVSVGDGLKIACLPYGRLNKTEFEFFRKNYVVLRPKPRKYVCGLAVNVQNGRLSLAVDGNWFHLDDPVFSKWFSSSIHHSIFPAASCRNVDIHLVFNFGDKDFIHPFQSPDDIHTPIDPLKSVVKSCPPVMAAAAGMHALACIELLPTLPLVGGANILHAQTGRTLLHYLVDCLSFEGVKLLVRKYQARVDILDSTGSTVVLQVVKLGLLEYLEVLLENGDSNVDTPDFKGGTPLMEACKKIDLGMAQLLLKHGADPEVVDANGDSAIYWATEKGSYELLQMLLQSSRGPIQELVLSNRRLALEAACSSGNLPIVQLLFESTQNIADAAKGAFTAACRHGRMDIVEYLLNHGVKQNLDSQYNADILVSIRSGNSNVALFLLRDGDPAGFSIISSEIVRESAKFGNEKVLQAMFSMQNVEMNRTELSKIMISVAGIEGTAEAIRVLINAGADVNYENDGSTALTEAIDKCRDLNIVKVLLENKANADFVDKWGRCPITLALRMQQKEMIEILVENGADINNKCILNEDDPPMTPLFTAIQNRNDVEFIEFLVKLGASLTVVDEKGRNALSIAVEEGMDAVASLLRQL